MARMDEPTRRELAEDQRLRAVKETFDAFADRLMEQRSEDAERAEQAAVVGRSLLLRYPKGLALTRTSTSTWARILNVPASTLLRGLDDLERAGLVDATRVAGERLAVRPASDVAAMLSRKGRGQ